MVSILSCVGKSVLIIDILWNEFHFAPVIFLFDEEADTLSLQCAFYQQWTVINRPSALKNPARGTRPKSEKILYSASRLQACHRQTLARAIFLDNRNNIWVWSLTELMMCQDFFYVFEDSCHVRMQICVDRSGIQGFLCLDENARCTYDLAKDWLIRIIGFMVQRSCVSILQWTGDREYLTEYLNVWLSQAYSQPVFNNRDYLGASAPSCGVKGLRPALLRQKQVEFTREIHSAAWLSSWNKTPDRWPWLHKNLSCYTQVICQPEINPSGSFWLSISIN